MILYSNVFSVNNMTPEKFIDLLTRWNDNKPQQSNIVPNVDWNGTGTQTFKGNNTSLKFINYNDSIYAMRYELNENNVLWATDCVYNAAERKISVVLDRGYTAQAASMEKYFTIPYLVSMLIGEDYVAKDKDLPISNVPISVSEENVDLLSGVILGKKTYSLPVVYVSKTFLNNTSVNVSWLANKLKGAAHVLVQSDPKLNKVFKIACEGKDEYNGAIGIYFPQSKKRIFRSADKADRYIGDKIVESIFMYIANQSISNEYTYSGVETIFLFDEIKKQKAGRQKAENEVNKVWDTFGDDLTSLQEKIKSLNIENENLKAELHSAKSKLYDSDTSATLLCFGNEQDLYPDEIKDLILAMLNDYMHTSLSPDTRRYHVCQDIIGNNNFERKAEEKRSQIKTIMEKADKFSSRFQSDLENEGFRFSDVVNGHHTCSFMGDSRYTFTFASTASDHRTMKNTFSDISRTIF